MKDLMKKVKMNEPKKKKSMWQYTGSKQKITRIFQLACFP